MNHLSEDVDISFTQEQVDLVMSEKRGVYLYAAGMPLLETIRFLKNHDVPIHGIMDKNTRLLGTTLHGLLVVSPDEVSDTTAPVIICKRLEYYEIWHYLRERGFKCILPFYFYQENATAMNRFYMARSICYRQMEEALAALDKKDALVLKSLDVIVTDRCSLRCRDCANLMQYYDSPRHEDYTEQTASLDAVMEAADYVKELRVLGGEPFACPDMYRYIDHMEEHYRNFGSIVVYTNGTILPKGENLRCLRHENIFIRISNYGETSKNLRQVQALFDKEHILYEVNTYLGWQDCAQFMDYRYTEEELEKMFAKCCAWDCYSLKRGKLFGCPFIANAATLRAIPSRLTEPIEASGENALLRREITAMTRRKWHEGCRWCAGRPQYYTESVPVAVQTKDVRQYTRMD